MVQKGRLEEQRGPEFRFLVFGVIGVGVARGAAKFSRQINKPTKPKRYVCRVSGALQVWDRDRCSFGSESFHTMVMAATRAAGSDQHGAMRTSPLLRIGT